MLNPDKGREPSFPVAAQKTDTVIRIDQIDGGRADVEDAEDAGLDAELPFASVERLVSIDGEGFAKVGGEDASEVLALCKLTIASTELRPARICVERGKEGAAREPFGMRLRNRRQYVALNRWNRRRIAFADIHPGDTWDLLQRSLYFTPIDVPQCLGRDEDRAVANLHRRIGHVKFMLQNCRVIAGDEFVGGGNNRGYGKSHDKQA